MPTDDITIDNLMNTGVGADADTLDNNNPNPNDGDEGTPNGDEGTPNNDANDDNGDEGGSDDDSLNILDLLPTLSENEELSNEIVKHFKGATIDEQGNVLDSEGKVVGTTDDVNKFINEDEILLDDNGNQVDEEGTIIKSAFDIAAEDTVVNSMHKYSGIVINDENGNPKIYEDSEEGFKALTDDIANAKLNESRDAFFAQNPTLLKVSKHLLAGHDLKSFQEDVDYDKLDIANLSDSDKEGYIRKSFEVKGLPKEQIDSMINLFKTGNSLDSQLPLALTSLKEAQILADNQRDLEYQQVIEAEERKIEEHWENVSNVVNKGKLDKINIPDSEKQDFINYLSLAVDDKGNSQEAIDRSKQSLEDQLTYSYIRFKGGKIDNLVKQEANKNRVKSLKERIKASQKSSTPVNDANKGITSGGKDVSIDELLS